MAAASVLGEPEVLWGMEEGLIYDTASSSIMSPSPGRGWRGSSSFIRFEQMQTNIYLSFSSEVIR